MERSTSCAIIRPLLATLPASGNVISRHDYLPFGEELPANVGNANGRTGLRRQRRHCEKYTGMETDSTGLLHTLWRKYDNLAGRWTTANPYNPSMNVTNPQSFNRYTYVNNDPINSVDPAGLALADIAGVPELGSVLRRRAMFRFDHKREIKPDELNPDRLLPYLHCELDANFLQVWFDELSLAVTSFGIAYGFLCLVLPLLWPLNMIVAAALAALLAWLIYLLQKWFDGATVEVRRIRPKLSLMTRITLVRARNNSTATS
jgi:RHS repeat-associated protein